MSAVIVATVRKVQFTPGGWYEIQVAPKGGGDEVSLWTLNQTRAKALESFVRLVMRRDLRFVCYSEPNLCGSDWAQQFAAQGGTTTSGVISTHEVVGK